MKLGGFGKVQAVPHCCSEAGTLALSRPDITDAMLHRKRGALAEALARPPRRDGAHELPVVRATGSARNRAARRRAEAPRGRARGALERTGWLEEFRAQAARAHAVHF